jgi:hypothetical protein
MLAWIFTVEGSALLLAVPPGGGRNPGKRAAEVKKSLVGYSRIAQLMRHPPVDGLHSIDF